MELFHKIDDAVVILRTRGLFKQTDVYRRGRDVFAKVGGGYIRLLAYGGTTIPATQWQDVEGPGIHLMGSDRQRLPYWIPMLEAAQ